MGQHAIHQQTSADFYRKKHSRVSATGPHRIDQRSGMKHDSLTGGKICGGHGQRNSQFFEGLDLQNAAEKLDHAFVAGESVTRQGPAGKVFKAHPRSHLFQLRDGDAAAVGCSDKRADAGAGDQADRNVFFFENFQNADMSNAAREAATQSQSDAAEAGACSWPGQADRPRPKACTERMILPRLFTGTLISPGCPLPQ